MTRKRRGRGEGSISRRKDGTWVASISGGFVGPKRRRHYVYAKTKTEAEAKLSALKSKRAGGLLADPVKTTLGEYLTGWLTDVAEPNLEPTSFDNYRIQIEHHVIPGLGQIRLQQLTPAHVQHFYGELTKKGLASTTRAKIHAVFRRALEDAVDLELLVRNPVAKVQPPKGTSGTRPYLSIDQIQELFGAVSHDRLAALYALAIFTTMREGELFGLQWTDIGWEERAIRVRQGLQRRTDGSYRLAKTKSKKGRRIDLPEMAYQALVLHRALMKTEGHRSNFVFCGPTGAPMHRSNFLRRVHYPLLEKAGLPRLTFHDLRHTAATLMLTLGVHPKVAQERLGHSNIRITMDLYSHAIPTLQEGAVKAIDARFRKG